MRILIVDDDQNGLLMLEAMLKGFGHEVVAAENGEIALELARGTPPGLIVSDILMPVMDGYALCREWKRDSKLRNIPFIFYTATYTDSRDEELALSLGAERFIVKPVAPDEFSRILQEIIRGVEKGGIAPKKPPLEGEKEVLKLYNERLVNKLEKKTLDLEREIAARKQAEEELLKAKNLESLGVLAGGIAHDFNNMLTAVSGNISLARMMAETFDTEETVRLLTEAEKAAMLAKDLTARLITFSEGEEPFKEEVSIGEFVKDCVTSALAVPVLAANFTFLLMCGRSRSMKAR
ncbi:MAG: response regulator [Pseudomonadota bacterium]